MKNKRIIWLLNHTTLMEFEVKLLIDLGFEIYVPKLLPSGCDGRTAAVSTEYDKTLSLPKEQIDKLNKFNFYLDEMNEEIINLINNNFEYAIVPTIYPGLYYFAKYFLGKIFVRVFGHAGDMDYELATTYTHLDRSKVYKHSLGIKKAFLYNSKLFLYKICKPKELTFNNIIMRTFYTIKDRIFLAHSYENIKENEKKFWKKRAIYLPLGIPESILTQKDNWSGGNNRIMFICPNINEIPYYENFYNLFIEHFGDLPYLIAGKQSLKGVNSIQKYNDPNIMGYASREQYDEWLKTCACMFYHSQEPRHLHYHPLEAIVLGMPLIYMSGGLLEQLGGFDQPGMVKSYEEARLKIERVLNGDNAFIKEIKEKQIKILEEFKYEYVKKTWEKNLIPIINQPKEIYE